jgi:hypothetical protein
MRPQRRMRVVGAVLSGIVLGVMVWMFIFGQAALPASAAVNPDIYLPVIFGGNNGTGNLIVLGWNDLGMHCYNRDFSDLGVLPPFNNLFVQVVQRGDPPKIITQGITVSYSFPENTYSVGKSNFWTYAQQLFNLSSKLPDNIGLTGKGLSGTMDLKTDHFEAGGIPLTEYNDADWNTRQPFQLATIKVIDGNGNMLATNQVVAPVSTEMRCDNCHSNNGQGNEGISTGKVEQNILTKHDQEEHTLLMTSRPVLCASCHASNALGTPGTDAPNLSKAMHEHHSGIVPNSIDGCYMCHPGPTTKCLRDVMSTQHAITCIDCHGTMSHVSQNPNPWLNEPTCASNACHSSAYTQNKALYRQSQGHGGLYCEACHDSTHAIAPSRESRDAIKFVNLQGHNGPLDVCTACHLTRPASGGPHR